MAGAFGSHHRHKAEIAEIADHPVIRQFRLHGLDPPGSHQHGANPEQAGPHCRGPQFGRNGAMADQQDCRQGHQDALRTGGPAKALA